MKRDEKKRLLDHLADLRADIESGNTAGIVLVSLRRSGFVHRTLSFPASKNSTGLHTVIGGLERCKQMLINALDKRDTGKNE